MPPYQQLASLFGSVSNIAGGVSDILQREQLRAYNEETVSQLDTARVQMTQAFNRFNETIEQDPNYDGYLEKWNTEQSRIRDTISKQLTNPHAQRQFNTEYQLTSEANRHNLELVRMRKLRAVAGAKLDENIYGIMSMNLPYETKLDRSNALVDDAYAVGTINEEEHITLRTQLRKQIQYAAVWDLALGVMQQEAFTTAFGEGEEPIALEEQIAGAPGKEATIDQIEAWIRNQDLIDLTDEEEENLVKNLRVEHGYQSQRSEQQAEAAREAFNGIAVGLLAQGYEGVKKLWEDDFRMIRESALKPVGAYQKEWWISAVTSVREAYDRGEKYSKEYGDQIGAMVAMTEQFWEGSPGELVEWKEDKFLEYPLYYSEIFKTYKQANPMFETPEFKSAVSYLDEALSSRDFKVAGEYDFPGLKQEAKLWLAGWVNSNPDARPEELQKTARALVGALSGKIKPIPVDSISQGLGNSANVLSREEEFLLMLTGESEGGGLSALYGVLNNSDFPEWQATFSGLLGSTRRLYEEVAKTHPELASGDGVTVSGYTERTGMPIVTVTDTGGRTREFTLRIANQRLPGQQDPVLVERITEGGARYYAPVQKIEGGRVANLAREEARSAISSAAFSMKPDEAYDYGMGLYNADESEEGGIEKVSSSYPFLVNHVLNGSVTDSKDYYRVARSAMWRAGENPEKLSDATKKLYAYASARGAGDRQSQAELYSDGATAPTDEEYRSMLLGSLAFSTQVPAGGFVSGPVVGSTLGTGAVEPVQVGAPPEQLSPRDQLGRRGTDPLPTANLAQYPAAVRELIPIINTGEVNYWVNTPAEAILQRGIAERTQELVTGAPKEGEVEQYQDNLRKVLSLNAAAHESLWALDPEAYKMIVDHLKELHQKRTGRSPDTNINVTKMRPFNDAIAAFAGKVLWPGEELPEVWPPPQSSEIELTRPGGRR